MIDGFSEPWPGGREGKREVAGVEDGRGRVRWRGSGAGVQGREGRWARGAGRPGGRGRPAPPERPMRTGGAKQRGRRAEIVTLASPQSASVTFRPEYGGKRQSRPGARTECDGIHPGVQGRGWRRPPAPPPAPPRRRPPSAQDRRRRRLRATRSNAEPEPSTANPAAPATMAAGPRSIIISKSVGFVLQTSPTKSINRIDKPIFSKRST